MIKACDISKGDIVEINGAPHIVAGLEVKTPSARGANTLYKIRFRNIVSGQVVDQSLSGDDRFDEIECGKRPLQFLYADQESATFMDTEDYMQYSLPKENLADEFLFLKDGMEGILGYVSHENLLTIELPSSVALKIVETPPAMKSASASARTKPATLETGLIVQVPEYMEQDEVILVNTEKKTFISRA